jgi:hypothetical protein
LRRDARRDAKRRSDFDGGDTHPVHYLGLSDLIKLAETFHNQLTPGHDASHWALLGEIVPQRHELDHSRDVGQIELDFVTVRARSLAGALAEPLTELNNALSFIAKVGGVAASRTAIVPCLDLGHPLDLYVGFQSAILERFGIQVQTIEASWLKQQSNWKQAVAERIQDADLLFVPQFPTGIELLEVTRDQILRGKPTITEGLMLDTWIFGPAYSGIDALARLLGRVGVSANYVHSVRDDAFNVERENGWPVFRKDQESLRHGQLFDGVDSLSFTHAYNLSTGGGVQRAVVGANSTFELKDDLLTGINGSDICTVATIEREIVPGSPTRVITIGGQVLVDRSPRLIGESPGIADNYGFAINALRWLGLIESPLVEYETGP